MIRRRLEIVSARVQDRLWALYNMAFKAVNEDTPICQSYPKADFISFLTNPRVVKVLAYDDRKIVGLGLITDQLELEPWLSTAYFAKYFPGNPIFYIMAIAVHPAARKGKRLTSDILRALIDEVPENGQGIFLHSRGVNPYIPKLAEIVGGRCIEGEELDAESLWSYHWARTTGKVRLQRAG